MSGYTDIQRILERLGHGSAICSRSRFGPPICGVRSMRRSLRSRAPAALTRVRRGVVARHGQTRARPGRPPVKGQTGCRAPMSYYIDYEVDIKEVLGHAFNIAGLGRAQSSRDDRLLPARLWLWGNLGWPPGTRPIPPCSTTSRRGTLDGPGPYRLEHEAH
jgi:hypothetical protein